MAATGGNGYDRAKAVKEFDESKMGVKGLSDAGIKTIPPFFIHPPQILSDLKSFSPSKTATIPLIDLSNLSSPTHRANIVQQVREAANIWGFFQIINHGVPVSVIDKTLDAIEAFHNLPHETKAKYYKRDELHGVTFNTNTDLLRSDAASWHDSLMMWTAPVPVKEEEVPEVCRKEMVAWDSHASGVAAIVLELLSEGLGLERGKFKQLTLGDSRMVAGHCYPYCPQPDLTVGIKPHTDPGTITVLLQNDVGGLQVKHEDEWVDVKYVRGDLIINIGDFLQIVSNGEYSSVEHRVLAHSQKKSRISIAVILNLVKWKEDSYYGPLAELLSPEKPPMYRELTKQEYFENFYSKGLDSKSLLEKLKIQN